MKPTLEEAAHQLDKACRGQHWFTAVGIGDDELILYVTNRKHLKTAKFFLTACRVVAKNPRPWEALPLSYKVMGRPRPLSKGGRR